MYNCLRHNSHIYISEILVVSTGASAGQKVLMTLNRSRCPNSRKKWFKKINPPTIERFSLIYILKIQYYACIILILSLGTWCSASGKWPLSREGNEVTHLPIDTNFTGQNRKKRQFLGLPSFHLARYLLQNCMDNS